jgi:hypothetical protein
MRVLRDVVVDRTNRGELLAVSHAPGIVGEEMSLDLMAAGRSLALRVRVVESRPVIVDGAVRHRIRLGLIELASETGMPAPVVVEAAPPTAEAM